MSKHCVFTTKLAKEITKKTCKTVDVFVVVVSFNQAGCREGVGDWALEIPVVVAKFKNGPIFFSSFSVRSQNHS